VAFHVHSRNLAIVILETLRQKLSGQTPYQTRKLRSEEGKISGDSYCSVIFMDSKFGGA
jgi:hypothetical protein